MDSSISEINILMVIFIGISVMLLLALAFVLFFYFSQKKFQLEQIKAQQKELMHKQELLFASISIQEKERQRIARELHDEVGSKLNVMNLSLHQIKKHQQAASANIIQDFFDLINNTLATTRRISYDLLPPALENLGLTVALRELCEKYEQNTDLHILLDIQVDQASAFSRDISLHLFRVAQELLSNSIKYANANHIQIALSQKQKLIILSYRDDGQGFNMEKAKLKKSLGLQNIESRMTIIGAEHQLTSKQGEGVYFHAKIHLT